MTHVEERAAHRARWVHAMLLLGLLSLLVRTGWFQLVRGDEFARRAYAQHYRETVVPAVRGRIYDREGRLLVSSCHFKTVAADPSEVDDIDLFSSRVALMLGQPGSARSFADLIRRKKEEGSRFVYLARRVERDAADRLASADLAGLVLQEEPRRNHPHGQAAAALLGFVGEEGRGLTGLEKEYDARLTGRPGREFVMRSGGRIPQRMRLFPEMDLQPVPGVDLHVTLDLRIQQIAEEALDGLKEAFRPISCCAVVLDPMTGEIFALAGRPSADLDGEVASLEGLRLFATQFPYEPGSTVKPLIMAGALTAGVVSPATVFDCGDGYKMLGHRLLHDVHSYGPLDLESILVKSSNIGMAQVGRALGIQKTYALLRDYGFGRPTGLGLGHEEAGKLTPLPRWREDYTLVSVSMGHELVVTPLQLALAMGSLINGGRLLRPRLVVGAETAPEKSIPVSPSALRFVVNAMVKVVGEGTGKAARIEGLRVGGKTGTAEKYPKDEGRYISSFLGFAPADRPALLVLVVADEPHRRDRGIPYGSVVAAPAVHQILRRALPLRGVPIPTTLSGSGVRQEQQEHEGMVRVAAVHRSSENAGGWLPPAQGRNPDSEGADCRTGGR